MSDQFSRGNAALANKQDTEAIRHWMEGLDEGDARCSKAITQYLRDTLGAPGGSWETIAHYLSLDLSEEGPPWTQLKYVGTDAVPLEVVDWSPFSFAVDSFLADPSKKPPPAWERLKDFFRDRSVSTDVVGQYEVGFWPAKRASAFCEHVLGGPSKPIPISVFFSAAADGSGLRIAAPLAEGVCDTGIRQSHKWFLESLYRLGEDCSREYAGKQPITVGGVAGRGGQFTAPEGIDSLERLYETADWFPRPAAWSGEAKWNFAPGSLQRLVSPIRELWAGYFVPMNNETRHLHLCIEGAIDAITHLADWHNAAFLEARCLQEGQDWAIRELMGISSGIKSRMAGDGEVEACWPAELTPMFAGMDRGQPDAIAAWEKLQAMAAGASPKKSW